MNSNYEAFHSSPNNHIQGRSKKEIEDEVDLLERKRKDYITSCNAESSLESDKCIDEYHDWYTSSKVLFELFFSLEDLDMSNFLNVDNTLSGYLLQRNYYKILNSYLVLIKRLKKGTFLNDKEEVSNAFKPPLLFISHATKDVSFVRPLVSLLQKIGFDKSNFFCSSVEGFGINEGYDIYDTLRQKFSEYSIHVVFVLSENYYKSPACLNEMGAAWVLKSDYSTILLPGFSVKQIRGAINPNRMAIVIDDESQVKSLMNDFRKRLMENFRLTDNNDSIVWETNRDEFLRSVHIH